MAVHAVGLLAAAALMAGMASAAAAPASAAPAPRVEARSEDLLAVGLVHGDRMTIRLSRTIDNAPVPDAALTVVLRGAAHPATAETDGSFTLESQDLSLPGTAAVEFQVARGAERQILKGTLQIAAADQAGDKNTARQLWWWVLNFAVCIGFLWLFSRRRKAAQP